jgi:hypothetical protein
MWDDRSGAMNLSPAVQVAFVRYTPRFLIVTAGAQLRGKAVVSRPRTLVLGRPAGIAHAMIGGARAARDLLNTAGEVVMTVAGGYRNSPAYAVGAANPTKAGRCEGLSGGVLSELFINSYDSTYSRPAYPAIVSPGSSLVRRAQVICFILSRHRIRNGEKTIHEASLSIGLDTPI